MTHKLFLSLVLSCVSGAALAAGMGSSSTGNSSSMGQYQSNDEKFSTLDTNGDGKLSKSEAAAAPGVQDNWASIDKDNDGKVDKSEFSAFESSNMHNGRMGTDTGSGGTDYKRPANPGSGMQ